MQPSPSIDILFHTDNTIPCIALGWKWVQHFGWSSWSYWVNLIHRKQKTWPWSGHITTWSFLKMKTYTRYLPQYNGLTMGWASWVELQCLGSITSAPVIIQKLVWKLSALIVTDPCVRSISVLFCFRCCWRFFCIW